MWDSEFSITNGDALVAAKNSAVKSLRIIKNGDVYCMLLELNWRKGEFFLRTARNTKGPREFHHIGRLVEFIETNFPTIEKFEISLDRRPKAPDKN